MRKTVVAIFAHPDDEAFGPAGTIALLVKKVFFLGYADGTLCNNNYHQLADDISRRLQQLRPEKLITFEHLGISGHIDHITVSMVVSYLFKKLSFVKMVLSSLNKYPKEEYFFVMEK